MQNTIEYAGEYFNGTRQIAKYIAAKSANGQWSVLTKVNEEWTVVQNYSSRQKATQSAKWLNNN